MKRKILAITGARSEFDLMAPIYEALVGDKRFDFRIIVTGAHLSERYGSSVELVEKQGFCIEDKIYNLVDSSKKIGRIISLGNQIQALAIAIDRIKPDIVLVAGDREEVLSVTATCAYLDVPVAHFFGGDIAKDGNIDNSVRYAASKMAHLHFPSMEIHKETLLKLGEEEERIFVIGNPALDKFKTIPSTDIKEITHKFSFDVEHKDYLVLIQHPIISQVESQARLIRITLDAILQSRYKCFINHPNSDAGNYDIILAYEEYASKYPETFRLFKNLERDTYVNLLRHAKGLIGNSSSGLTEAPSLGLPAINIGTRQRGRIHGANVIFVDNDKQQILSAIEKIDDETFLKEVQKKENPYGKGDSADTVLNILATIEINDWLLHKNITY